MSREQAPQNPNPVFGDSDWDLLYKIASTGRDNFDRLFQVIQAIQAGGGGDGGGNVNITGINGVAPDVGAGTTGAGTLRVTLPTDGTGVVGLIAGSAIVGKFGIDQTTPGTTNGVSLAQLGANTIATGNGTSSTGVLRVAQVSDGTGVLASIGAISTSVTPGTAAANLGKAEDAVHSSGDTGVFILGVSNEAQSTRNADGDYSIIATDTKGNLLMVGNLAHDAVDAGNPVKIGAVAVAHGTNPTAVAAGDRTNLYANRAGVPFVIGGHPNIITRRDAYTTAQTDTAIVTVGAGTKIVVVGQSVVAANSNTVDVSAIIGFGSANTPTGAGVVLSHPGIAHGSGFNRGNGGGILGVGGDGEDLRITSSVPTGGSIEVITEYYTIES